APLAAGGGAAPADTDRQGGREPAGAARLVEAKAQALHHRLRPAGAAVRRLIFIAAQRHHELVAAVAPGDVAAAHALPEELRQFAQHLVAAVVAARVVD